VHIAKTHDVCFTKFHIKLCDLSSVQVMSYISHKVYYAHVYYVYFSCRLLWWAFMPLSMQHEMLILTGFNNVH